jgi:hypothetical protein
VYSSGGGAAQTAGTALVGVAEAAGGKGRGRNQVSGNSSYSSNRRRRKRSGSSGSSSNSRVGVGVSISHTALEQVVSPHVAIINPGFIDNSNPKESAKHRATWHPIKGYMAPNTTGIHRDTQGYMAPNGYRATWHPIILCSVCVCLVYLLCCADCRLSRDMFKSTAFLCRDFDQDRTRPHCPVLGISTSATPNTTGVTPTTTGVTPTTTGSLTLTKTEPAPTSRYL